MQKSHRKMLYLVLIVSLLLMIRVTLVFTDESEPVLVKDITTEGDTTFLGGMTDVDGTLFFGIDDYNNNNGGLWKSDGTAAGTVRVKENITPHIKWPDYRHSETDVNGTLFFVADDGVHGAELWKSDGTTAGTVMVKDIVPGDGSPNPYDLTNVNGTLFFFIFGNSYDGDIRGLWKSDGTTAGTVRVKDIYPERASSSGDRNVAILHDTLFFLATDDGGAWEELWKSDGTTAGTVRISNLLWWVHGLINVNDTLFFEASDGVYGGELWKSDGTAAGTVMIKDIWPGELHSQPQDMTNVNGTLFFTADDGTDTGNPDTTGRALWKSDGTATGTVKIKDVQPELGTMINVDGTLFFEVGDSTDFPRSLWKSDGTTAGTIMLKDFNYPTTIGYRTLTNVNGTVFFPVYYTFPRLGSELWKSDGTSTGTITATNLYTGSHFIKNLTSKSGTLFFTADDGTHGQELWKLWVGGSPPPPPPPTPSPPDLNIESVELEHKSVENGQWISTTTTYDGNIVRITANIENIGGSDGSALVKFINDDTDETIGTVTQNSFPVGQVTSVSFEWDTSGLAWKEDGSAQISPIPIKIVVSDVEETASLIVYPKPVILVHGLASSAKTWKNYYNFIVSSHIAWQVYAVGDGQASGIMNTGDFSSPFKRTNTIAENSFELFTYIEDIRKNQNAWQVDLVTHSMGGLISRHYIQYYMPVSNQPAVSRLLMLGTPNGGSPCADIASSNDENYMAPVMNELRTDYLSVFNKVITERKGVKFSIIAGNQHEVPCSLPPWPTGDLVVTVNSALTIPIADSAARTGSSHLEMTGSIGDYNSFVKPRLSNVISINSTKNGNSIESKKIQANTDSTPQLTFGEVIDIPSSDTQTVSLPQIGGSDLHILLANMSTIDASLRNPSSVVVDTIIANSDEANQMFVSMSSGSQVNTGTYTLELTNVGTETVTIPVNAWVENDPVELEFIVKNLDQPEQLTLSQEQIQILATFANNGNPILGGDIIVKITDEGGNSNTINLFDDGNHEDGQANDGIYGNVEAYLAPDIYLFNAKAEGNGIMRLTSSLKKVDSYKKVFLPIVIK